MAADREPSDRNSLDRVAASAETPDAGFGDLRFRTLLSRADWDRLPLPIRRRFSKRLADGASVVYVGEVVDVDFSRVGWWLAQLARLIGGPLPTGDDTGVPFIVTVTEDGATAGQIWTRICGRRRGFPQVIHSSKRFKGPTGLEEYVGCGISMALRVRVDGPALVFCSAGYAVRLGPWSLALPALFTPGDLTVTHCDLGSDQFQFTIEIVHRRFGRLLRQSAVFREVRP